MRHFVWSSPEIKGELRRPRPPFSDGSRRSLSARRRLPLPPLGRPFPCVLRPPPSAPRISIFHPIRSFILLSSVSDFFAPSPFASVRGHRFDGCGGARVLALDYRVKSGDDGCEITHSAPNRTDD